jgi:DNA gyrase/topoisomerase IV subunit B
VAAGLMREAAHHRRFVHPAGDLRQVLANLHTGSAGGDRLEFAAGLLRGVGLEVVHILRRGAAEQVQHDHTLRLSGPDPPCFFGRQPMR